MASIFLKEGKEKSLVRRHPWVYATAIARIKGTPAVGDTVDVHAANGQWLARGAFSPESALRVRVWSFASHEMIDRTFFEARLRAAIRRREHLRARTEAIRLVFGEADGLPGLVVDQYGKVVVAQLQSAGCELWKSVIFDLLPELTGAAVVYERSDAAVRAREGLTERSGLVWTQETDPEAKKIADQGWVIVREDGIHYRVDFVNGHKTGFYVDQRDSRFLVRQLVQRLILSGRKPDVLNCFSYTGGFSLAASLGGAACVTSVDSSADALSIAATNAGLNNIPAERFQCATENVFDYLKAAQARKQQFDMVILDPPKFAPSAHHVEKAARAYKDLNMRGLGILREGGYLLTFSCSGAISVDLFQKIVAGAVIDAKIDFQLEQRLAAGADHPMSMTHPEGEYLKGLLLRRT